MPVIEFRLLVWEAQAHFPMLFIVRQSMAPKKNTKKAMVPPEPPAALLSLHAQYWAKQLALAQRLLANKGIMMVEMNGKLVPIKKFKQHNASQNRDLHVYARFGQNDWRPPLVYGR